MKVCSLCEAETPREFLRWRWFRWVCLLCLEVR